MFILFTNVSPPPQQSLLPIGPQRKKRIHLYASEHRYVKRGWHKATLPIAGARDQTGQKKARALCRVRVFRTIGSPRGVRDPVAVRWAGLRTRSLRYAKSSLGANPPIRLMKAQLPRFPWRASSTTSSDSVRRVQAHLSENTQVTWLPPHPIKERAGPRMRNLTGQRRRPRDGSGGGCGSEGCSPRCCCCWGGGGTARPGPLCFRLVSQPRLSPPGPSPASGCPMSVSLVVIRLELAEHSPVPAGFGFSAAGESAALPPPPWPAAGPRGASSQSLSRKGPRRGLSLQEEAEKWLGSLSCSHHPWEVSSQVSPVGSLFRSLLPGAFPPGLSLYLARRSLQPGWEPSCASWLSLDFVKADRESPARWWLLV